MIEVTVSPTTLPIGVTDLDILLVNRGQDAYLNVIFTIRLPIGLMRLRGADRIGNGAGGFYHSSIPRPPAADHSLMRARSS